MAGTSTLNPVTYWERHAEAWSHLTDVQVEAGDVSREEFYEELTEAAEFLTDYLN